MTRHRLERTPFAASLGTMTFSTRLAVMSSAVAPPCLRLVTTLSELRWHPVPESLGLHPEFFFSCGARPPETSFPNFVGPKGCVLRRCSDAGSVACLVWRMPGPAFCIEAAPRGVATYGVSHCCNLNSSRYCGHWCCFALCQAVHREVTTM